MNVWNQLWCDLAEDGSDDAAVVAADGVFFYAVVVAAVVVADGIVVVVVDDVAAVVADGIAVAPASVGADDGAVTEGVASV